MLAYAEFGVSIASSSQAEKIREVKRPTHLIDVLFAREDAVTGGLHRWGDRVEIDGTFHVCAVSEVDPVDATAQLRMRNTGKPVHPRVEYDRILVGNIQSRDQSRFYDKRCRRSWVGDHIGRWKGAGKDQ